MFTLKYILMGTFTNPSNGDHKILLGLYGFVYKSLNVGYEILLEKFGISEPTK